MILATHGIIGGALGRLVPAYPAAAFFIGVISHFITDAIPHWHYPLFSHKRDPNNPMNNDMVLGREFLLDLLIIGLDFAVGMAIPILLFGFSPAVIAGAFGGVIPDFFQFLYMKFRRSSSLTLLQQFHIWIHSKTGLDHKHFTGIGSQTGIAFAAVLFSQVLF